MKSNWRILVMEAAGLAGFVLFAGILTIILEHPDLPVMNSEWANYDMLRRIPLGILMGIYIWFIILVTGKKSGAHINPSVTWTFYRLGKINLIDAVLYTIAQFAGAIVTSQFLKYASGKYFGHPFLNYGVTAPQPSYGSTTAFVAEFIISFIMMLTVLTAISSKQYEKYVASISGVLIAIYLIIELPFSGMSLNPARSTASSLAAHEYEYLWIYFVAPTMAMLLAAEIYLIIKKSNASYKNKNDFQEIPTYPISKNKNNNLEKVAT